MQRMGGLCGVARSDERPAFPLNLAASDPRGRLAAGDEAISLLTIY